MKYEAWSPEMDKDTMLVKAAADPILISPSNEAMMPARITALRGTEVLGLTCDSPN